jgi:cytochrome c
MKRVLTALFIAAGVLAAPLAQANADLAQKVCGKCHEMDKKKKGPSYKETAAKFKGKADAEAQMLKLVTDPKGDHPEFKASPDEIKTVLKWILTQ